MNNAGIKRCGIIIAIFVIVSFGHNQSRHITSTDSQWAVYTAVSILREGNIDLNEFQHRRINDRFPSYGSFWHEGRLYPWYPIGPSITAVPVMGFFMLFPRRYVPEFDSFMFSTALRMEMYAAAFIVALTSVILFLTLSRTTKNNLLSFLLVMVFSFCTSAWSTASRALWQHGPSMLMLAAAVHILLKSKDRENLVQFAALPLAFSFWIRPTNIIPIGLGTLYVLVYYRRFFLKYLLWFSLVTIPFLALNLISFGRFLQPYYAFGAGVTPGWKQALPANLISPNRGLLVFSPVLFFSFWGMFLALKKKPRERVDVLIFLIIFFHWLGISLFAPANWWAGHSYGPRLFSDVLPLLVFFMGHAAVRFMLIPGIRKKAALAALFILLAGFSCFTHYRGAYKPHAWSWNVHPADIDKMPSRVWDWRDLQFLR